MAKIVKLIWRLDYKPSYAYLDARGTALRVLSDTVQKFWDAVGDGVIHMSFAARHADEDTLRSFSLETTAMVGTLEWRTGTELALVLEGRQFRGFDRIARELLNVCEVRDVARAGVRIFGMERYRGGRKHALERTVGFLDDSIREAATSALGPITDIGIIFEGVTTDNVGYRAVHGPYDKKNVDGVLEQKPTEEQYELFEDFDLFFDIDLFERNFSFAEHSLFRWAETKIAKAKDFIELCSAFPQPKQK
jgi:hypothetical protein